MEPFSITCTTCKSRLKVKSQAAVGHLLKCPKCGGMVMVKLPGQPKPGESADLRAETAPAIEKPTRAADAQDTLGENQDFGEIEALLAAGASKGLPPAIKGAAVGSAGVKERVQRFAEGAPSAGVAAASGNGKQAAPHPAPGQDAIAKEPAPPIPGSEYQPLPSGDWSGKRPWKSWLFLAVSILLGTGLAFGVVAFSLSYFQKTPIAGAIPIEPNHETPGNSSAEEGVPPSKITVPAETTAADKATEMVPKKGVEEKETPSGIQFPENPATAEATPQKPSTEEDPLGLLKKPPVPSKSEKPAIDPLSKFDNLVENRDGDPTAPRPAELAPAPKPAEPTSEIPPKASLPRPPPRTVNITARMNDPMPGLAIAADEVTLADFLQFMQDFSTIPITLEPDNLVLFKLSADTRLGAYDAENMKFGATLTAVLTPLGLEAVVEGEHLIVRKPELIRDKMTRELKLMPVNYDVKDLTHDDEKQAAELAERIMAVIEPGSWGDDEDESACSLTPGKQAFAVRHGLSAQANIRMLFEKLRVARGLPLTLKNYDADTFRLATRSEKGASRLDAPVSITFNRPTPLVKICQKLSAAGKMRILIDWRSIAAAGWNPEAELTLVVDKKPLSEALASLVEPMDLAYRVVDGRTIQIVSRQYLKEHLELELHSVKELIAGPEQLDPFLARVRSSLADDAAEGAPSDRFWIDAESKTLVAMLPQPKQQLLTRLLTEWRTKETN